MLLLIATAGLNVGHAYKDATRAVEPCGVCVGGRGSWALVLMILCLTWFVFKKQKDFFANVFYGLPACRGLEAGGHIYGAIFTRF